MATLVGIRVLQNIKDASQDLANVDIWQRPGGF